jgi:hypothetical protein
VESFESGATAPFDIESTGLPAESRSLGLVSCYEARLASTMLVRAMDRELARRPLTTKCGRLARAENASLFSQASSTATNRSPQTSFVQVVARSPLQVEPA